MNKKIFFFLYLISNLVFSQDYVQLKEQCERQSLIPIRPGTPDKKLFWNEKATRFIYAPAFNFNNSSWRYTTNGQSMPVVYDIVFNTLHLPHFERQNEKRNFVEKGTQNYGRKENLSNIR